MNPEGATEVQLKQRALTNLYNERPAWLENAHVALDRAVWDAYGWTSDEDPGAVEEDVTLGRLLALNQERAVVQDRPSMPHQRRLSLARRMRGRQSRA